MYTERKTEINKRIAITEWLKDHFSEFKKEKTNFIELYNGLKKAIGYSGLTIQCFKTLLEEVAQQQGYNVSFETEIIKAEKRNITVFVLTQIQNPPETPLTIDIRACSYNPEVRAGLAPITAFDVLQWFYAATDSGITPSITADGSIYLIIGSKSGYIFNKIAKWDIRYPYLNQQPISLIKALESYYYC